MPPHLETATFTHPGPRPTNQDAADADPELGFAAVADGMGGAAGGGVASTETLAGVRSALQLAPPQPGAPLEPMLTAAAGAAQRRVCVQAQARPELQGMGSTLALVLVTGSNYGVANVGDSRVYLVRNRSLTQLSHDHSLVQIRVDRGEIPAEAAASQPDRNVITRAIGVPGSATPHLIRGEAYPGDRFLVTSDGVHGVLTAPDLLGGDPDETAADTARRLVQRALERGTTDNATAAVLRVLTPEHRGSLPYPLPRLHRREFQPH